MPLDVDADRLSDPDSDFQPQAGGRAAKGAKKAKAKGRKVKKKKGGSEPGATGAAGASAPDRSRVRGAAGANATQDAMEDYQAGAL